MINKKRLAIWVIAVIRNALWFLLIGGTVSILLARNGEGVAALIVLAVTLTLVVATVASYTRRLARAFDRATTKQEERIRRTLH